MRAGDAGFGWLVGLFDEYRVHYGEESEPARTEAWLAGQLRAGRLRASVAELDGVGAGFLTSAVMPASLRLGEFWVVRDLFVRPGGRRGGVGRALLDQVVTEAREAGAVRVSLQTEPGNGPALGLYEAAGFRPVEGLTSLSLPLVEMPAG
ncbi:GNAT family N-acetyltransferase [Actinoplanes sp. HUAS TT8]|uniref:GNAT family N-acetyltransferase n=1 Tax=Actinoplanes sp. HUAS TT8 TaxID=3447453 RepID=UPI003F51AF11